jgi:predicted RNA-binding protein with PUA-like domain
MVGARGLDRCNWGAQPPPAVVGRALAANFGRAQGTFHVSFHCHSGRRRGRRRLRPRAGALSNSFHSECKIPKAEFEMGRPQAVARRKVRVWGMARIPALNSRDLDYIPVFCLNACMSSKTVAYWWLNANPKMWELEQQLVGETETYSSHNKNGNKRRKYKWFHEVKPGDIVIGYVTSLRKKAVAICRIMKGLHSTDNGDEIKFQKIEQLVNPIAYETLKLVPELANSEPLRSNHQGSLFKLTDKEYKIIRSLESRSANLIADIQEIQANKKI